MLFQTKIIHFPNLRNNANEASQEEKDRQIFDGIYPSLGAARTIPEGKSIACSTERALAWDASFRGRADQSGRSVGVHTAAYDASFDVDADKKKAGRDDVNSVGLEF